MQRIQGIFREVQENFTEEYTLSEFYGQLDNHDAEFRSVAYEAASMCIALLDLKEGSPFIRWKEFLKEAGGKHDTQIHIGLGWALAQQSVMPAPYLGNLAPMMRYRVLDGYGYYDGFFRKRKSIMAQQKPDFQDVVASGAYDQGLGRSIWYLSNGELEEAKKTIEGFPSDRQKDLWRGLGIAVAYVGGLEEPALKEIHSSSGKYKSQFSAGVAMSIISRYIAGFIPDETERICQLIGQQDIMSLLAKDDSLKLKLLLSDNSAYEQWIQQMEILHGN